MMNGSMGSWYFGMGASSWMLFCVLILVVAILVVVALVVSRKK
jgi:uncharacterized membrane protein